MSAAYPCGCSVDGDARHDCPGRCDHPWRDITPQIKLQLSLLGVEIAGGHGILRVWIAKAGRYRAESWSVHSACRQLAWHLIEYTSRGPWREARDRVKLGAAILDLIFPEGYVDPED